MRYLSRFILVFSICLLYTTSLAQNENAGIEFNGRIYQSLAEVRQASVNQSGASGASGGPYVGDSWLYCGVRLTESVLVRGHYDGRHDPVVCFTSEAKSDQLYAENRALRDRNQHLISTNNSKSLEGTMAQGGATGAHGHYVCQETPRGTPFRWVLYI